jgi:gliding motility-associated-like protein
VQITTQAGCVTVDTQWVRIVRDVQIRLPSAFTPNNDGRNDRFRPLSEGLREIRYFRVYNRWGQLLYQWRGGDAGWDGTRNGIPQESGVYIWMLEASGLDNKTYFRKGTVTLIR